jgi:hypothetical protein
MRSKLSKVYLVGIITLLVGALLCVICALLYTPLLSPFDATFINTIIPIIGVGFSFFGCVVIASAAYATLPPLKKNMVLLLVGIGCVLLATVLASIIPNANSAPYAFVLIFVSNAGVVFIGGFIGDKVKKLRYLLILALVSFVGFFILYIMAAVGNWSESWAGTSIPIMASLFLSFMFVITAFVKRGAERRRKAGHAPVLVAAEGTIAAAKPASETERQQAGVEQRRAKEEKKKIEAEKKRVAEEQRKQQAAEKERAVEEQRKQQAAEKERLAKEEEAARLAKLRQVLKVSTRISIAKVAELIRMDEKILWDRLIEWGDALKFKIDGTDLLVGADSADGFIKALEGEFAKWGQGDKKA